MKTNRWMMKGVVLLSSCAALVFAGCFAPVAEGEAPGSDAARGEALAGDAEAPVGEGEALAGDGPEQVGVSQEELTACQSVYRHGGSAIERTYTTSVGCYCGDGFVRDRFTVWNDGDGDCSGIRWLTSDPRDCRILVSVKDSGGWFYGNCNYLIEKKEDLLSCKGHCGGQAPGGCYCDAACTGYGDCCADYGPTC
ncbi:hypothetical protein [Sorangium sp. So ce1335]|uniref:hypothetical protein n=1 Tax=Sorangium sp. So ce1335 TaxID=3133335 RepID=UPI003F620056